MRYLLDTHVILWYADASQELPLALRDLIDASKCFYSVASLWEIAIKQGLGRLNRDLEISSYDRLCRLAGFQLLQISPLQLERLKSLPNIHRDPFDRPVYLFLREQDV